MTLVISDDKLTERILQIAQREQRSPTEVLDAALHLYEQRPLKISGVQALLAIAGQGMSDENDVSERDEEILRTEIDSVRGWRPKRDNERPT
jgi:predicted transcriptional regulator